MNSPVAGSGQRPCSRRYAIACASFSVIFAPVTPGTLSKLAIQVERRADQRQVRERLREVAEQLTAAPDLLRVEPELVGVGEHLLAGEPSLVHPPGAGKRLDVPEGADRERALVPLEAVLERAWVVAEHQGVRHELL